MNPIFKFAKLLKPYRKFIAESILSGIFLTLLGLPGPWLTKILIDSVYPTGDYSLLHFVLILVFAFGLFRGLTGLRSENASLIVSVVTMSFSGVSPIHSA